MNDRFGFCATGMDFLWRPAFGDLCQVPGGAKREPSLLAKCGGPCSARHASTHTEQRTAPTHTSAMRVQPTHVGHAHRRVCNMRGAGPKRVTCCMRGHTPNLPSTRPHGLCCISRGASGLGVRGCSQASSMAGSARCNLLDQRMLSLSLHRHIITTSRAPAASNQGLHVCLALVKRPCESRSPVNLPSPEWQRMCPELWVRRGCLACQLAHIMSKPRGLASAEEVTTPPDHRSHAETAHCKNNTAQSC